VDNMLPPHHLIEAVGWEEPWEYELMDQLARTLYRSHSKEKVAAINRILDAYEQNRALHRSSVPQQLAALPRTLTRANWSRIWDMAQRIVTPAATAAKAPPVTEHDPRAVGETLRAMPRLRAFLRWVGSGKPPHRYLDWMKKPPQWFPRSSGLVRGAARQVQRRPQQLRLALSAEQRTLYSRLEQVAAHAARYGSRALSALAVLQVIDEMFDEFLQVRARAELSTWHKLSRTLFGRDIVPELLQFGAFVTGRALCMWDIALTSVPTEHIGKEYQLGIGRRKPYEVTEYRTFIAGRVEQFHTHVDKQGQGFAFFVRAPWLHRTDPLEIHHQRHPPDFNTRLRLRFKCLGPSVKDHQVDMLR